MSRISIRGVESTGETTVGLYYDETPVTGPAGTTQDSGNNAADLNLFDVNGVEVLRGPQGTLYAIGYQPAPLESRNDELRLSSNGRGPVQWTLGGYLEDRHDHIVSNIASANPSTGEAYLPLEDLSYRYINTYTRQTAEFSEISYTPLSDLTLTFGARHYSYTKRCRDCSNHRDSCDLPARKAPAHPAHRADFPKDPWAGRRDSNP